MAITKVLRLTTDEFLNYQHGLKLFRDKMHENMKREECQFVPDSTLIAYYKGKIAEVDEQLSSSSKVIIAD